MNNRLGCPALSHATKHRYVLAARNVTTTNAWKLLQSQKSHPGLPKSCRGSAGWSLSPCGRHHKSRSVNVALAVSDNAPLGTSSDDQRVWSPGELYQEGAERLRAFMAALPEVAANESLLGALLSTNPALAMVDPQEVRQQLEGLAQALDVSLLRAARLASRVPAVWERPPVEAGDKVRAMASELDLGVEATLDLYGSQPGIWAVKHPSIIKDRLDVLSTKLGLPLADLVGMVGRQAMLWVVPPVHIISTVGDIAGGLGLSTAEAEELVARVPPVVTVEKRLRRLSVQGVSSTTGVPVPVLLKLLSRSLGLLAVPTELMATSLERLAADLSCRPEDIAMLMTRQPTLLCAQYGTIQAALEALEIGLGVNRTAALEVLVAQPCLLYDVTAATVASRLEALGAAFGLDIDSARELAAAQPALLVVAPATLRSAVSLVGSSTGSSLAECVELARSDPGAFIMATLQESLLEAWSARLELPAEAVSAMLTAQPSLLELTATTVKARMESLAALFGVPLGIAAQLVLKHAALAAVPPNATITRAKNISMALRISMQGASNIIAKEPAMLAVLAYGAADLRGSSVAEDVSEVGAVYEYYTMDWMQRQFKEMQPSRVTSFATLDS